MRGGKYQVPVLDRSSKHLSLHPPCRLQPYFETRETLSDELWSAACTDSCHKIETCRSSRMREKEARLEL